MLSNILKTYLLSTKFRFQLVFSSNKNRSRKNSRKASYVEKTKKPKKSQKKSRNKSKGTSETSISETSIDDQRVKCK